MRSGGCPAGALSVTSRGSFLSESFLGEFGGNEREIVDAVVHGDAVDMSDSESRCHATIVALPV